MDSRYFGSIFNVERLSADDAAKNFKLSVSTTKAGDKVHQSLLYTLVLNGEALLQRNDRSMRDWWESFLKQITPPDLDEIIEELEKAIPKGNESVPVSRLENVLRMLRELKQLEDKCNG